ncbi:Bug family tripartite tricarboxylate transporter substrate binding protein [Crenalkalicoccus roseus]|uniref:Bug family tripartite tricarboxylate transporter substrate binding protein n=1 Tax=Crenalkalicoccus roseus TaxID=1485588 RepID=UPI00108178CC|nr:tripartite tricarboxylate transporter substrate binding protein [Crenalkalicoccus roseus]
MPGRRTLLTGGTATLLLAASHARAQERYPTRPVTVVNGYPPGGLTDTSTRAICERLQQELGQPVVVENRPGAATAVASQAVAQARPDGYTLLMGATTLAINPTLQPDLAPREPLRELTPIGLAYRTGFVLHVHPDLPVRSVAELIAYAKANPGRLNWGSSGVGAVNHLSLELFRIRTGIDVLHVPYRGGAPALIDLRQGRIHVMFAAILEALPALREGHTRGLAVSSRERLALLPDLPPVAETVEGFETSFWQGLFGPAGLPEPIVSRLSAALQATTRDEALRTRLAELGVQLEGSAPAGMREILVRDTEMWGRLIREANIQLER